MLLKRAAEALLEVSGTYRQSFRSASVEPSMAVVTLLIEDHPGAMSLEADDIEGPDEEGTETNQRSERKRKREKQRRTDLSNAFDELAAFVVQVDPEPGDADLEGKKKRKKSGEEDSSGITRLDLIGRALKLMKRLHKENEERKRIITTMQDRGGQHGPNDNVSKTTKPQKFQSDFFLHMCVIKVLVMVPTLTPVDDNSYPVARAAYPSYPPVSSNYYQHGSPVPHGAPDYGMAVPSRGHPQYQATNWGHRYGGPPPPPPQHHHPQGMQQAQHGPPQRSQGHRHSESGQMDRRI